MINKSLCSMPCWNSQTLNLPGRPEFNIYVLCHLENDVDQSNWQITISVTDPLPIYLKGITFQLRCAKEASQLEKQPPVNNLRADVNQVSGFYFSHTPATVLTLLSMYQIWASPQVYRKWNQPTSHILNTSVSIWKFLADHKPQIEGSKEGVLPPSPQHDGGCWQAGCAPSVICLASGSGWRRLLAATLSGCRSCPSCWSSYTAPLADRRWMTCWARSTWGWQNNNELCRI